MLKFDQPGKKQRYEKVLDFAREVDALEIERFYVYSKDLWCSQILDLYVQYQEQVTKIFLFTKSSTQWFISKLPSDLNEVDGKLYIPFEYMYNFDLVRIIPKNGYKYIDSYLRVMVKPEWDKGFKSIEDEFNI
jgi:hypothetical protein